MKQLLANELQKLKQIQNENELMIAFVECIPKSMSIQSGEEALSLITQSERVDTDLKRWLECPSSGPMNVILRRFDQTLRPCMEFRGFVYKRKLNCLSQYYDICYYKELVEQKHIIQEKILNFFETIKEKIPYENCVIDFVVNQRDVLIIEINPWANTTGGGLFQWSSTDRKKLFEGPFEFRIIEEPIPNISKEILPEYRDLMIEVCNQQQKTPPIQLNKKKKAQIKSHCQKNEKYTIILFGIPSVCIALIFYLLIS